jgi:hypothetical protein
VATSLSSLDAEDIRFWRRLRPSLSIEGSGRTTAFDLPNLEQRLAELRFEGYVNIPNVVPRDCFEPLRDCICCLKELDIPVPFVFVYDEFWQVFQGVSAFIASALGPDYRALPDFWVWHVPAKESAAGWGPHRDRVVPTLEADNSPHSLTVWMPFSDATPLNGCIYMLPAHLDERFKRRVWDGEDNIIVKAPQDIRAVPAPAGSLLAWNQAVLHWGGRASRLAAAPRCSAAFEYQRGDKPAFNTPLLDPQRIPPFTERLGLIGKQVLQYQHMYPLSPGLEMIAKALRDRYMPGRPASNIIFDDDDSGGGGGGGGG